MSKRKSMYLETTAIPATRSIGEMVGMLAQAGAGNVNQRFAGGRPVGLSFTLMTAQGECCFQIPARTNAVFMRLKRQQSPRSQKSYDDLRAQAERIAWRQLNAWVKAQLAIIELGMVEAPEVFMPYLLGVSGLTMWEDFSGQKALTAGEVA